MIISDIFSIKKNTSFKLEIDFGVSGLLTSRNNIQAELPSIADFLESAHSQWCLHLSQLRIKYPSLRSV